MIDSHAHLYFDSFDADRPQVIERARAAGIKAIINIGIDAETSQRSVQLAMEQAGLFAAAGVHPTSKVADLSESLEKLAELARAHPGQVVAVGEIGLDYHWKDVPPEEQKGRLKAQLALARKLDLPVIFHCREALEDLLSLLEAERELPPGVFHCFSGGPAEVDRAVRMAFHLSFAGNVTYPKATLLHEAARSAPIERLLLETDCPFLAPQACRGKRNEPAFVKHTRDFLAQLKGISPEELESRTDEAATRLFALGGPCHQRGPSGDRF